MRSKLLFSVFGILCGTVVMASPAHSSPAEATFIKPAGAMFAIDLGRSVEGIVEGVINLCSDGDAKAELIATQENVNTNADGTAGWTTNAATQAAGQAAATALTNGVYDYVQSEVLSQTDLTKYADLQKDIASPKAEGNAKKTCESLKFTSDNTKNVCLAVVDTFFADKGEKGNTEEYKESRLKNRQNYAQMVAKRHIVLGYNVQQKVIQDLQAAAKAPVSSDNEIGAIAIDGQTLDEMLKVTVADVALQIEMMEADAVDFLLQQPAEMMPENRPTEEGEKNE